MKFIFALPLDRFNEKYLNNNDLMKFGLKEKVCNIEISESCFLTYIVICNVRFIWKRWNICFINTIHVFSCLWMRFSKAHNFFFFWNFNENVKSELRRIFLPHLLKFGIISKPEVLKLVLQIWIHWY